jgi:acid stress-induced BolA-like protein IbaG/YrbA
MNTSKVKRILSGEAKLTEGSTVEVEFDGLDYETIVVTFHAKCCCYRSR